jgi:hypothetical protein
MRCLVLDNVPITFGNSGFTHLIRKDRKVRPFSEVRWRMDLLKHAPFIITDKNTICGKTSSANSTYGSITYFSLTNSVGKSKIRMILRQYGTGNIHFLSIMTV